MKKIQYNLKKRLRPISEGTAVVVDLLIRPQTNLYIPESVFVLQFGLVLNPGIIKRLPLDLHEGDIILRAAWKADLIRTCSGEYVKSVDYIDIDVPDVPGFIIKPDDYLKLVYHRDIIAIFDDVDDWVKFVKHLSKMEGNYGNQCTK